MVVRVLTRFEIPLARFQGVPWPRGRLCYCAHGRIEWEVRDG